MQKSQNNRYGVGKGTVYSIYAGLAGKVLLANFKDKEINQLLKNIKPIHVGPNTITDLDLLKKRLLE